MPPVSGSLATEIREHWARQDGADAMNGLHQAVLADPRTSSAILSAPHYLSGLTTERQDLLRTASAGQHAAQANDDMAEATRARDKLQAATTRMVELLAPRLREWATPGSEALTALKEMSRG